MAALSVLFVGGTGKISSACVVEAIERGFEVSVLNRHETSLRPLPEGSPSSPPTFAMSARPVGAR